MKKNFKKLLAIAIAGVMFYSTFTVGAITVGGNANKEVGESVITEIEPTSNVEPTTSEPSNPVEPEVEAVGIDIKGKTYNINKGSSLRLVATVTPANAVNGIRWKSVDTSIATVDENGKVTAKKKGMTIIIVTTDNGYADACIVNVIQKATSVKMNKSIVNLKSKGKRTTIGVTVYPKNTNNKKLVWKSSNKKVAVVNSKGKVTAKGKGHCTITVITRDGSKKYDKCLVVVGNKVKGLKMNKKKVSIPINKTYSLKATATNKDAAYKAVKWTTTNKKVATINNRGVVRGVKKGTCYIKAATLDGSKKTATCRVTVTKLVTKVTLNKSRLDIEYGGKSVKLKATVTPTDASNKKVKWTSSNTKVATVNKNGVVVAKGLGTAVVKATALDGSRKSARCTVVSAPNLYKKLSVKQFNTKVSIDKYCDFLNDYFESCGAVINPYMKGSSQWCVASTSLLDERGESIYDFGVECVGLWTARRSQDAVKNREGWNGMTTLDEVEVFIEEINSCGTSYLDGYNPKKILDKDWNGWGWYCDLLKSWGDQLDIYVCAEPVKNDFGETAYIVYMYWNSEANLEYLGIPVPNK